MFLSHGRCASASVALLHGGVRCCLQKALPPSLCWMRRFDSVHRNRERIGESLEVITGDGGGNGSQVSLQLSLSFLSLLSLSLSGCLSGTLAHAATFMHANTPDLFSYHPEQHRLRTAGSQTNLISILGL